MIIQGKEIDINTLTGDDNYEASFGDIIEDGRYVVMTVKDAKAFGLSYMMHWYSSYGPVAWVPVWSASSAAAELGRKGGSAKTEAKQKSSRENGKKGGRPRGSLNKKKAGA